MNYEVLSAQEPGPGPTFVWNGRTCHGNRVHAAVLANDIGEVKALLTEKPELVSSRFHYETKSPKGEVQEGSGEPIHLAVSRSQVSIARYLVEMNASLTAMVTRAGQGHYDVLHASIFAEGRGGTDEMVLALIEMRAPLDKNLNGEYPLHKAFQTGKLSLIHILRDERERRGLPDLEDVEPDHKVPTPLELGVSMGKMREDELASVAPLSPLTLHVFSRHEPRCIPAWLARCTEVRAVDLARHVNVSELVKVFNQAPMSGDALLKALTSEPEVECVGWHALPTRVSFASRSYSSSMIDGWLNPQRTLLYQYSNDDTWAYDASAFKAPAWHAALLDRSAGRPIRDVDVRICHVPNLACAEFFSSLADGLGADDLFIFDNTTVRALIAYIWEEAAMKNTCVSLSLGVWALALQVLEMYLTLEKIDDVPSPVEGAVASLHPQPRMLHRGGGRSHHANRLATTTLGDIPTVTTFIIARGFVELLSQLIVFAGYVKIGEWHNYFTVSNIFTLTQGFVSIALLINDSSSVYVVLVLIYWMFALFDLNLLSENIARAMLPITDLIYSLRPTITLTVTGYIAFTQAFFIMRGGMQSPADLLLESFATLFTGALPASAEETSVGELILTIFAVLVFLVFILNIFIGVISEQFTLYKEIVPQRFQQVRANECLRFLLRAKFVPNVPGFHKVRLPCIVVCAVTLFVLQALGLRNREPVEYTLLASVFCTAVMFFSIFQYESAPWNDSGSKKFYIWMITPQEEAPAESPDLVEIRDQLMSLQKRLDMVLPPSTPVATPLHERTAKVNSIGRFAGD